MSEEQEQDQLDWWVIYDRPKDHPYSFVARRWIGIQPTRDTLTSSSLDALRLHFELSGLYRIPRAPEDDPVIVESWI